MKKRILALVTAVLLLTSMIPLCANAMSPRAEILSPGLSFTGTTAHCELTVNCDYLTDSITATVKLWNGNSCVATWYKTGSGYLDFYATRTVVKGNTYTLTADVTVNGEIYPTVSITRTCE